MSTRTFTPPSPKISPPITYEVDCPDCGLVSRWRRVQPPSDFADFYCPGCHVSDPDLKSLRSMRGIRTMTPTVDPVTGGILMVCSREPYGTR